MMQKPGDRRLSDRDLFLRQSVFEFGQSDVRLLRYQLPHQILVRRQREILVAAEFGRVDAARLPVKLEEADDGTDADPALLRSFGDGGAALDRPDHSPAQIRRIWLRHSCWPPPSRQLESYSRRYGNPRFSLFGKRSKLDNSHCFMVIDATSRLFFLTNLFFMVVRNPISVAGPITRLAALLPFQQMLRRPSANHRLWSAEAPPDAGAPDQTQLVRCAGDQIRNYGKST